MKLRSACFGLIVYISTQAVYAEEPVKKDLGVSFKNLNGLYIRKSLSDTALLYAGFNIGKGQQYYSSDFGSGTFESTGNDTFYAGIIGGRKYLSNEKISKFINLEVARGFAKADNSTSSSTISIPNSDAQTTMTSANITYGIEYFISPSISIEGSAGVGMYWIVGTNSSGTYSTTKSISLPLASIALTYYW